MKVLDLGESFAAAAAYGLTAPDDKAALNAAGELLDARKLAKTAARLAATWDRERGDEFIEADAAVSTFLAKAEAAARSCGSLEPGYEDREPDAWRSLAFTASIRREVLDDCARWRGIISKSGLILAAFR